MRRASQKLLTGAIAGLAGGLAGTLAMTQFQKLWQKAVDGSGSGDEPATVRAARRLLRVDEEHDVVQYAFGALNGALYGAFAEISPQVRRGAGAMFGASLFMAADEGVVPLLGWSKGPTVYPLTAHLYGLASHVVYGVTTDAVRRLVRKSI
jgi:putative membrane protein